MDFNKIINRLAHLYEFGIDNFDKSVDLVLEKAGWITVEIEDGNKLAVLNFDKSLELEELWSPRKDSTWF